MINQRVTFEKFVQDGEVAVLYSPGYGAGWSTWADSDAEEAMIFDRDIVQAVLDGDNERAGEIAVLKYDAYVGGARSLKVKFVPEGVLFRIDEYDGNESVEFLNETNFYKA